MAIYSGRYGSVNGVPQVLDWSIESTMSDDAHASSYTKAGKRRDVGVMDWTGSLNMEGLINFTSTPWAGFAFVGRTGAGTLGGTGMTYSGNAVWTSLGISGDMSSNARIRTAASFGGNGPLAYASGSGLDSATPDILMSKDCVITWGDTTVDWQSFSVTVNNEVQTYVGSSTVAEGFVWTARYPGLFDWTGNLTVKNDSPLATNGDIDTLTITCGSIVLFSSEARFLSHSGLSVNPQSGDLIGYTANFGMSAYDDNGVLGSMTLFGTQIWPESSSSSGT